MLREFAQQRCEGVATRPCRIQVDEVQPFRTLRGVAHRDIQRRAVIACLARIVALGQPDHATFAHIDRGINGESAHCTPYFRKFSSRRAPTSADRSGWNWAPPTLPRCTMAANGTPCSLEATQSAVTGA